MIEGRTPLHYAADYGHSEVIGYLIDKGGDIDVSDTLLCYLEEEIFMLQLITIARKEVYCVVVSCFIMTYYSYQVII